MRYHTNSRRWVALLVTVLAARLAAQDGLCVGERGSLGSPGFSGGDANIGGYSLTVDGLEIVYDAWSSTSESSWIMAAAREPADVPFAPGSGVRLPPAVNTGLVYGPRISPDGRFLYFAVYGRAPGPGRWDIWMARREEGVPLGAAFQSATPLMALSTGEDELPGCVSPDGREFFFARGPHHGFDLWVAEFVDEEGDPSGGFRNLREIDHLSGPWQVLSPSVSPDGRYLFWSDRPMGSGWGESVPPRPGGVGGSDLWMAVRPSLGEPFGPAIHLPSPVVNQSLDELCPWVWQDPDGRSELVFSEYGDPITVPLGFGSGSELRARFSVPELVVSGANVLFDAGPSSPAEEIVLYEWTVGREQARPEQRDTAEGPSLTYHFETRGRYQVTLVVSTDDGQCDWASRIFDVVDAPPPTGERGDANRVGKRELTDAVYVLNWLFLGGPAPSCPAQVDTNDDGKVDIADPTFLLNWLFVGGPRPGELEDCEL